MSAVWAFRQLTQLLKYTTISGALALSLSASAVALAPSDPDYVILKNLLQNYQCVQGFNSGLFTNKTLTDAQFARVLSQCSGTIQAKAEKNGARGDLSQLNRLRRDYLGQSTPAPINAVQGQTSQVARNTPQDDFDGLQRDIEEGPRNAIFQRAQQDLVFDIDPDTGLPKTHYKNRIWGGIGTLIGNPKTTFTDFTPNQYPDFSRPVSISVGADIYTDFQPVEGWNFLIGGRFNTFKRTYDQHKNVGGGSAPSNGKLWQTYLAIQATLEKPAPIGDIKGTFGFGGGVGPLITNLSGDFEASGVEAAVNIETFYRFPVSDQLTVAPVFMMIFPFGSPDGNVGPNNSQTDQDPIFIGAVRAIFEF